MSGITLTDAIKTNIASYLTDVLLPDMVEGKLREEEGYADDIAGFVGVVGAGLGALTVLSSLPGAVILALGAGSFGAALTSFLAGKIISPTAARLQTDNYYWYLVKRKIYCRLPATTDLADLTEVARDRIAREIENIVPYNGADFGSKTSVNTIVSGIIRSFSITQFKELLEAAAQWAGNPNGTTSLINDPIGCGSDIALIPIIGDTGIIPASQKVGPNTWLIGASQPGQYKWRTAFKDQTYRVDGYTLVQPPTLNPAFPFVILWNDGVQENVSPLTYLPTKCFDEMLWQSDTPFSLYITISECAASPVTHPSALVQFEQLSQTISENSSGTLRVRLYTGAPLTNNITVDVNASPAQGVDFTYLPTQALFEAGSGNGSLEEVTIAVLSDSVNEGSENVVFTLANATGGAQIGLPNTHVLTITNQWEHTFDFTQGQQGWSLLNVLTYSPGTHVPGEGFRLTFYDTPNPTLTMLLAGLTFPSANVTRITWEMDQDGIEGKFHNRNAWIAPNERNAQNTLNFSSRIGSLDVMWGPMSAFAMDLWSNNSTIRTMKNITFYGTGLNPFV